MAAQSDTSTEPPDPLEVLLVEAATDPGTGRVRLLTVTDVATALQLDNHWVYEHARALGALRLGAGSRSPIRFDPRTLADRLRALDQPALPASTASPRRRGARRRRPAEDDGLLPLKPRIATSAAS
jgi:hypothetical protein